MRHCAGRPVAPPRCPDHRHRKAGPRRRFLAQPLQVAVPAWPGLVRPSALPALPRRLAGVCAQGQDRRLAGDVHQGHGDQLLGLDRMQKRAVRRGRRAMDRQRRTRRPAGHAAAHATGAGHRHRLVSEPGPLPGRRALQGRAAPLQPPSRRRWLCPQRLHRHHLPQLPPTPPPPPSRHPGGDGYAGKDCIVIGSNNSAHDISADLWEHGANVTMVQRSSTLVAKSETLMELGLGDLYSERALSNGISTDKADLIFASLPYKVLPALQVPVYQEMARRDADLYERLKKVGFKLDFGEDDSGGFRKAGRRGGGYYIDVGASELVATGKIKLKSGVTVKEIKEHSVLFSDGTELPADLIVYATGYGSMDGWIAQLISQQVADKVGRCWGLDSGPTRDPGPWEGELRNMWKPTRQPGLWLHGGNLHLSRHYSQFLALQLKARMENLPTPVYGMSPVPQTA